MSRLPEEAGAFEKHPSPAKDLPDFPVYQNRKGAIGIGVEESPGKKYRGRHYILPAESELTFTLPAMIY